MMMQVSKEVTLRGLEQAWKAQRFPHWTAGENSPADYRQSGARRNLTNALRKKSVEVLIA